jgi:hypothetical protein
MNTNDLLKLNRGAFVSHATGEFLFHIGEGRKFRDGVWSIVDQSEARGFYNGTAHAKNNAKQAARAKAKKKKFSLLERQLASQLQYIISRLVDENLTLEDCDGGKYVLLKMTKTNWDSPIEKGA